MKDISDQEVICPNCSKRNIIGKTFGTASDDETYFWCKYCGYREEIASYKDRNKIIIRNK